MLAGYAYNIYRLFNQKLSFCEQSYWRRAWRTHASFENLVYTGMKGAIRRESPPSSRSTSQTPSWRRKVKKGLCILCPWREQTGFQVTGCVTTQSTAAAHDGADCLFRGSPSRALKLLRERVLKYSPSHFQCGEACCLDMILMRERLSFP